MRLSQPLEAAWESPSPDHLQTAVLATPQDGCASAMNDTTAASGGPDAQPEGRAARSSQH